GVGQGFLKSLVAWIYQKLFADELAAEADERKKLLAELESLKAEAAQKVQADQAQIDQLEAAKAPLQEQIVVEQKRQAADEAKIAKVKSDEAKAVETIVNRPDSAVLRDDF